MNLRLNARLRAQLKTELKALFASRLTPDLSARVRAVLNSALDPAFAPAFKSRLSCGLSAELTATLTAALMGALIRALNSGVTPGLTPLLAAQQPGWTSVYGASSGKCHVWFRRIPPHPTFDIRNSSFGIIEVVFYLDYAWQLSKLSRGRTISGPTLAREVQVLLAKWQRRGLVPDVLAATRFDVFSVPAPGPSSRFG